MVQPIGYDLMNKIDISKFKFGDIEPIQVGDIFFDLDSGVSYEIIEKYHEKNYSEFERCKIKFSDGSITNRSEFLLKEFIKFGIIIKVRDKKHLLELQLKHK